MPIPIAAAVAGVAGLVQGVGGLIQQGRANKQLNKLFKQRTAFETPSEIFDILQMNQYASQTGFGADTMDFLTGQADRGLSSSLGTAQRLGADPNAIGGILDSHFKNIFKIGSEDELLKMKKFDSLLNATQLLAANKEAEWLSKENILKDKMAALATKVDAGRQNLQSGANLGLNALVAAENFYKTDNGTTNGSSITSSSGVGNRGLLDYNYPDLDAGGRPIPRRRGIVN